MNKKIDPTGYDPNTPAGNLYACLDALHGDASRAKYRLTTEPDEAILAELVYRIGVLAASTAEALATYEAVSS